MAGGALMRGLYGKYIVKRADGSDEPGGKHHGCQLFVLDLTHDPCARDAALVYANITENKALADDLRQAVEQAKAEVSA